MAISSDSAQGPVPAADLETSPGNSTQSLSPTTVYLPSSSESASSPSKSLTKPAGGIPPELPPSVEAAYRKKCIQLRQRMNEVEEANDAARQRLARLHRGIQKLRLERAFLLEQLAKRTSTNVEDSEGSPSPPPTPKEKPLRTKRGHRKPDFLNSDIGDGRPGTAFIQQGPVTLSPSSDAFSHTHPDVLRNSTPQAQVQTSKRELPSNGTHPTPSMSASTPSQPRRLKSVFELYCKETRPLLAVEHKKEILAGTYDIDNVLAQGWSSLDQPTRDDFLQRFDYLKKQVEAEKEAGSVGPRQTVFDVAPSHADEDVEMAEDATDAGTPSVAGEGGFTAVNRA
ncbi:hypothetical protein NA56DRAFT_577395 [Hyaloscypha hepaticicola]|uniref:INO80 complex subunit F domain-containing protein n=1 Tax=Hyaloscypha hepaticicola TaxID=2082293 RepID=A0A2J6PWL5_9HELO|nr:hypothetical protein NA56DRAFT_577395 [Hyaloscypha hepaticicola]